MKIAGEHTFPASRQRVWDLLHDPDAIRRALPGVERFEPAGDNAYEVTIRAGVAAVRGTYQGRITMTDLRPPAGYTLVVQGRGTMGTIAATVEITLTDQDDQTVLGFSADAQVGGLIAGVGQRMLEGVARLTASQFFAALEQQLAAPATAAIDDSTARPPLPGRTGHVGSLPGSGLALPAIDLDLTSGQVLRLAPAALIGLLVGALLGRRRQGWHAAGDAELAAAIRDLAAAVRSHSR